MGHMQNKHQNLTKVRQELGSQFVSFVDLYAYNISFVKTFIGKLCYSY